MQQLETYKGVQVQPVYLVREPETALKSDFEPQRVRVLANHIGMLQCDPLYRVSGSNWAFSVDFSNYNRGIQRIALNYVQLWNTCPNINIKNNILTYFDNGDATFKTATLTVGFYNLSTLATELQTALNTSVPAPVAPFVVTVNTNQFSLNVTNPNLFYFDPTSIFITRGQDVAGFPSSTVLTTSLNSNVCKLIYNLCWFITSNNLVQYAKNVNVSSNVQVSNILGIVSNDEGFRPSRRTAYYSDKQWINFFAGTQISNLSFRILDQYGEDPNDYCTGDPHIEIEIYTEL